MKYGHMAQCEPRIKIKKKKEDKNEKRKVKMNEKERVMGESERREKKRKKKVFRFFLRFMEIEPSVFVRARRKVDPRIASYA